MEQEYNVESAMEYLSSGGLGEVIGLAEMSRGLNCPKVQMDTDMAMALCILAGEALAVRSLATGTFKQ